MTRFEIVMPVIEAELAKPYAYGTADCFFFGCRVADALDPSLGLAKTYAGAYKTYKGAQRAMWKRGFTSISDLFDKHLERIGAAKARFGDIAVLLFPDGEHVGVCIGSGFMTKTQAGRVTRGLDAVKAAYRVG